MRLATNKTQFLLTSLMPVWLLLSAGNALAQSAADFISIPPLIADGAPPSVMLVMSNDHELYKKAYSDYTDLDGDLVLDTTYNDNFTYSGYFDSSFCYNYTTSNGGRFEPVTNISTQITAGNGHICPTSGAEWSGNFLNWASMTRIDISRTVLYGGYRYDDTATSGATNGVTVLERSFLPEDVHSFVKVYTGVSGKTVADFTPYPGAAGVSISMCNTTPSSGDAPRILIGSGSYPQWSASEVEQCKYGGQATRPGTGNRPAQWDLVARVVACKAGTDSSSNRCKAYFDSGSGDITYKPVGLLQRYGDNGAMNFGLLTGSYNEKIQGGVLRKDILPLVGNATNADNEINTNTGVFINQGASAGGIINTLNRLRIVNWDYGSNSYSDCSTHSIDINTFKTSTSGNRQCRNWGNPLSEIYLEAVRYFAGTINDVMPTTAFNVSDSDQISSLPQLTWSDPLDSNNACASCSIIVISTGLNSFDKDNLGSMSALGLTPAGLDDLVDDIGDQEGITGGSYLIGNNNGGTGSNACTAKIITNLSDAVGLCPEIPALEGGFDIAGLAYHARTTDLRADFDGLQSVRTFSIALAESLPSFELDVGGELVSFVPTCQASTNGSLKQNDSGWNDCSLVDVIVERSDATSGSILIAWEDSHWGNDYDMDGIARLEYCIGTNTAACTSVASNAGFSSPYSASDFNWKTGSVNSVQFRLSVPQAAAGNALRFGYIVSGVVDQGSNTNLVTNTPSAARSGSSNITNGNGEYLVRDVLENGEQPLLLRQGGHNISRLNSSSGNGIIYVAPAVYTSSTTGGAGRLLNNPLWYVAKYGNFDDQDNDGTPSNINGDTREWDVSDTLGNSGADGIPDSFFPVRNPTELITSLSQIFETISERISSGTAAAVVANSSTGLGAVYQAYYHPRFTDDNERSISWGGVLHAMFIDESGRFREDNDVSGNKGTLDSTNIDYVIDIFYDQTVVPNRARFQRYSQTGTGPTAVLNPVDGTEDLEDIGSIWNARDILADMPQVDIPTQRTADVDGTFTEPAQDKRYILTYLDRLPPSGTLGEVDPGELVDFTADTFALDDNDRYLALDDPADTADLVNYIRGQDIAGWRSRLVDIPGDGDTTPKPWILGDIVHSSPLVVNPPDARYDLLYGDATYAGFRQKYAKRRQMVYVGGNDGMLHAFNGGVWSPATKTFYNKAWNPATQVYDVGEDHALGAEMWAYVPMNILPHLQWLTDSEYEHIYYMDAPPQSFDVNIFTPDATHPNGWGTILVAGMRLGGGDFPVDLDGDSTDETVMSSAYVILDITDVEKPPQLIAEVKVPNLGFTTSQPALIKARAPSTSGDFSIPNSNRWVLVFGAGPDQLSTVTSSRTAEFFAYDLVSRSQVTLSSNAQVSGGDPDGYFGDMRSVDWNNDYIDDVVYAGTVEGDEDAPEGRVKRVVLSNTSTKLGLDTGAALMSDVIDINQPVVAAPATRLDVSRDERWLMFGTGRLFTRDDNKTTANQSFYGVKEADDYDTTGVTTAGLVNTTNIIVTTDGDIHDGVVGADVSIDSNVVETVAELNVVMNAKPGWKQLLSAGGSSPSERVVTTPLMLGSSVVFSSYLPSVDICTVEGSGFLNALNFRTGTAEAFGPFGSDGDNVAYGSVSLGQGAPSTPTAVVRTGDDPSPDGSVGGDISVITGSTTGVTDSTGFTAAPGAGGRISWESLEILF